MANQLGKKRTLCEAYGAGGWDLRFEDMKRIGDWLYVLGINTLDQHLSYITIRGARKWDYPQSFSYHEPWWKAYHVLAGYFTRLSAAMSQGEQVNRVLLLEPTTSAWIYQLHDFEFYQKPMRQDPQMKEIGDRFQDLVNLLERAQVEYDIGCEDILMRHGKVEIEANPPCLVIGRRAVQHRHLAALHRESQRADHAADRAVRQERRAGALLRRAAGAGQRREIPAQGRRRPKQPAGNR